MKRKKLWSDSAIIEAIKSGDNTILTGIYDFFKPAFVKWACSQHKIDDQEIIDVYQDTFIAFYENVLSGKFEATHASCKSYLFSIGKNKILDSLKKSKHIRIQDVLIERIGDGIEKHNDERKEIINREIELLGIKCKEILKMFYYQGFDMESIAERMGYKSAMMARKKKYLCLKKLEEKVKSKLSALYEKL